MAKVSNTSQLLPKPEINKGKKRNTDVHANKQEAGAVFEKSSSKVQKDTIQGLREQSERAYSHLRQLVKRLLEQQGHAYQEISAEEQIEVDEKTRLEAEAMISDGGFFSPEKVSDRIVKFAMALAGEDKSKIGLLRNAIEEGFQEAAKVLGGKLPEISQKTYDLVMEKLDKWENGEQ